MTGRMLIMLMLVGASFNSLGAGDPALGALRIDTEAYRQADVETVRRIEELFNRAEKAIGEKDLDALMTVYSDRYRYQELTKADMRNMWKGFMDQYERISTLHSFSRIVIKPGNPPTAQITCTGALWATSNQSDQRVNLSSWVGDIHHLLCEHGAVRIVGQGREATKRPEFGPTPPTLC